MNKNEQGSSQESDFLNSPIDADQNLIFPRPMTNSLDRETVTVPTLRNFLSDGEYDPVDRQQIEEESQPILWSNQPKKFNHIGMSDQRNYESNGLESYYLRPTQQFKFQTEENESTEAIYNSPEQFKLTTTSIFFSEENLIQQAMNNNILKEENRNLGGKKWSIQEDTLLTKYHSKYDGNWLEICKKIKGRNASQCFQRWRRMHPNHKQQRTTFSEAADSKIIELVKKFGNKWLQISKVLPQYKPKQIRDRYLNVLDENINKAEFTNEEDQIIINLYMQHGAKWKLIAHQLKNRNDNDVKNRFYTQLRKRYFGIENRYQVIYKNQYED